MIRFPFRSTSMALAAFVLLAGCATPVFRDAPVTAPSPATVAAAPERYHDLDVVWGGRIIALRNLADTTEVQVVAYPLERGQRPATDAQTQGRFVVVLPGYVEAMDYPTGRYLSVRGHLNGTQERLIDEHEVVHPMVRSTAVHVWPVNYPYEHGRVSFGFGLGVGIR
jgi:outer membrane lipoprotein